MFIVSERSEICFRQFVTNWVTKTSFGQDVLNLPKSMVPPTQKINLQSVTGTKTNWDTKDGYQFYHFYIFNSWKLKNSTKLFDHTERKCKYFKHNWRTYMYKQHESLKARVQQRQKLQTLHFFMIYTRSAIIWLCDQYMLWRTIAVWVHDSQLHHCYK